MPVTSSPWRAACDARLLAALRSTLQAWPVDMAVGVALSAGADSAMLALHTAVAAADAGRPVHCFHIHHGLQTAADDWLDHAQRLADLLGLPCHTRRVQLTLQGHGMEAAARAARYQALSEMARAVAIQHMLLAHHQDDQAETVLLRLLRGAGPTGLAAMAPSMQRDQAEIIQYGADGLSPMAGAADLAASITYHRPWLNHARARILQAADRFADLSAWQPVQDPSNRDCRYARGALRAELAPVLDAHWPAWRQTLARHARQAQDLVCWTQASALDDWLQLDPQDEDRNFSLVAWRRLPAVRQAPVLRFWLQGRGLRMPTEARLNAWLLQLRGVHALGHDRQVQLRHDHHWIVVQKGRVCLLSAVSDANTLSSPGE
ncbi:tRNA lysidine(34) synthetase TilS [Castellaniella sp.]|uniref:tRNA lysidine(34) synthetase TilS n=1 Tax=Castellaniella sp. TaxID=1955812 RepID=UPI002AFDF7FB|nr:tRNA lysidine(34) synthetase TilS [Castellaniella sp.]